MSTIQARALLDSISGYTQGGQGPKPSSDRPVKLGTIEQYYTVGNPRVLLDGETAVGEKRYSFASHYTPRGGDRVYLVPVGQSYIIAGKVAPPISVPQFIELKLENSWRAYDADAAYYKPSVTRTASGVVTLTGLATGGSTAAGTVLTVLPEPFRPLRRQSFPALANNAAAGLDVSPDGTVRLGAGVTSNSYLSLDNVTFTTDTSLTWYDHTLVNSWTALPDNATDGPLTPQYTMDSLGRVWHRGGITRSTAPAGETAVNNAIPAAMRSNLQLHYKNYGATTATLMDTLNTGVIRWKAASGNSGYWYIDAMMYAKNGTPFTALGYQNGWVSNSASHPAASYWKDSDGLIHLQGLVRSGTMGAPIATLPEGFRPGKVIVRNVTSGDANGRVDVYPSGNITPNVGTNVWLSLDGIVFVGEK